MKIVKNSNPTTEPLDLIKFYIDPKLREMLDALLARVIRAANHKLAGLKRSQRLDVQLSVRCPKEGVISIKTARNGRNIKLTTDYDYTLREGDVAISIFKINGAPTDKPVFKTFANEVGVGMAYLQLMMHVVSFAASLCNESWGIVPRTFEEKERLSALVFQIELVKIESWLAINGAPNDIVADHYSSAKTKPVSDDELVVWCELQTELPLAA